MHEKGLPPGASAGILVAVGDRNIEPFPHPRPPDTRLPMTTEDNENLDRARTLEAFAEGVDVLPILVQRDPDPDGMASAMGLRRLLHREEEASPIISLGEVTRPENRRMAEMLGLQVVRVSATELNGLKKVIVVDTHPEATDEEVRTRYAVVDHHPRRWDWEAEFVDLRPLMGAAATMVTQYLRAAGKGLITPKLATALLYGIRTDTDVLRRGATPEDVEAYAFLQGIADHELLRKIGRPAFSERGIRALGEALAGLAVDGHVVRRRRSRGGPSGDEHPPGGRWCRGRGAGP